MGQLTRRLIQPIPLLAVAFGVSSCVAWDPVEWLRDNDDDDDDTGCFLFCPECTKDSDCEFECLDGTCTECSDDDDCEFECSVDKRCTECRVDADCGGVLVCDHDVCRYPVCDVDFACEEGALCLNATCTVLPCDEPADDACVDRGFLCHESGTCRFADEVTGVCDLGPVRSSLQAPLLLSASMERQDADDDDCPAGVAWRVDTITAQVTQGRVRVFADTASVPQPLLRSSVERDLNMHDFPVERGEAVVCVSAAPPFEAQINVGGDQNENSNGFCLTATE